MALRKSDEAPGGHRLDAGPYAAKVRKARKRAERALSKYGEPGMPLDVLQAKMAEALQGTTLTQIVIEDREARR